jgi:hypothetical protein
MSSPTERSRLMARRTLGRTGVTTRLIEAEPSAAQQNLPVAAWCPGTAEQARKRARPASLTQRQDLLCVGSDEGM